MGGEGDGAGAGGLACLLSFFCFLRDLDWNKVGKRGGLSGAAEWDVVALVCVGGGVWEIELWGWL